MYLKSLEILGFKSFAQKTRLVFEPGITAIVGPNGCGKSNISDAIRWVLGEQRPTVLRGTSMSDVIFNGTDAIKPLGMAEVSITFADCEDKLGVEYNEVTVTRRVFRSGEGQYFLNRKLCRLRDIQRLFMGTGIGTTSYSVMAQGQIDAILSSRPEDRRVVFEEASGITRFKADRKEALRKLEQTDANLLRLSDVIREVRRQIGSLQRQAGKARRYKELRTEMRALDIWVSVRRLRDLDSRDKNAASRMEALEKEAASRQTSLDSCEERGSTLRQLMAGLEHEIGLVLEESMQAQNRLSQARELLRMNEQRLVEYQEWSQRDMQEITETRAVHNAQKNTIETLADQLTSLEEETRTAEKNLSEARSNHEQHREKVETARKNLQELRSQTVECERAAARAQTELAETEARERGALLQSERLGSEKAQLTKTLETLETTLAGLTGEKDELEKQVAALDQSYKEAEQSRHRTATSLRETQQERGSLQTRIATRQAQIQMLEDPRENADDWPAGARLLMDPANPLQTEEGVLLGALAEKVTAPPEIRPALEAALRPWLDALVVRDSESSADILARLLASGKKASARLVALDAGQGPPPSPLLPDRPRLLDHLRCEDSFRTTAERLLAQVYMADNLADIPVPLPSGSTFVTKDGLLVHDDGCCELWMPEGAAANPFARHMLAEDAREELARLELELSRLDEKLSALAIEQSTAENSLNDLRRQLDESRRDAARKDGELQSIKRDVKRARERMETVTWEHEQSLRQMQSGEARKRELADRLAKLLQDRDRLAESSGNCTAELQNLERSFADSQGELTECRLRHAALSQQTEHARTQHRAGQARLQELEKMMQGRERGLQSYAESIARLKSESAETETGLPELESDAARKAKQTNDLREKRAAKQAELEQSDNEARQIRQALEQARDLRAKVEVERAEINMHRRNQLDRLLAEYQVEHNELHRQPEPDWPDGREPDMETAEGILGGLRERIEALGPVNLVAIEEYQSLEERYAFLAAQEEDLVKGKDQIMDLIRKINKESSELFRETFEQANINFQYMFEKLFNGGTAQLVLMDSEDLLESGIDIIARPPGKRLQSVSLLSGGERTMTAVALLFAIYMIKPSPFALLDELDASLDDSNIGRFVGVLKDFLSMSQFVIITHNQYTIAGADIVYGVTMPQKGVSTIVSMRLKTVGVEEPQPTDPDAPPEIEAEPLPPPGKRKSKQSTEKKTES